MAGFVDLTGQNYGRLTVVKRGNGRLRSDGRPRTTWICKCECGIEVEVQSDALRSGNTRSCGCLMVETTIKNNTRHGYASRKSRSPEYEVWTGIKKRCGTDPDYLDISVCDRWANSFEDFLADMGSRPSPDHSIDRIDPFGDYEPGNCRWILLQEQAANKRGTRWVTWEGEQVSAGVLARKLGISRNSLYKALNRGLTIEHAIERLTHGRVSANTVRRD